MLKYRNYMHKFWNWTCILKVQKKNQNRSECESVIFWTFTQTLHELMIINCNWQWYSEKGKGHCSVWSLYLAAICHTQTSPYGIATWPSYGKCLWIFFLLSIRNVHRSDHLLYHIYISMYFQSQKIKEIILINKLTL